MPSTFVKPGIIQGDLPVPISVVHQPDWMMATDIQESPRERFVGAWLDYSKEATLTNSNRKAHAFRMLMSCGKAKGIMGGS